jgi:DNA-binding beta-propeller fold protein YncE
MKCTIPIIFFCCFFIISAALLADETNQDIAGFEFFKEGVYHFNRKSYEAAIEFFRKTLGENPRDSRARFFLGLAYYKAGFNSNALFEFNTILQSDNENELLANLARYLSTNRLLRNTIRKRDDYAIGKEIRGNPLGKYILSRVTGIDVDDLGNIYAAGFGSKIALKISQEGKPLFTFNNPMITPGRLYDIVRSGDGTVFISDFTNDTIYRFTEEGKFLGTFGGSGSRQGQFYGPTAMATDKHGDLYVIDSGNVRIEKFSKDGEFLLTFGREGDGDDEFYHPSGIAVAEGEYIYVSDHGKRAIMVFDRNGNYIHSLSDPGLNDPYGLSISEGHRLIVSDKDTVRSYDLMYSTWAEIDTGGQVSRVLDATVDRLGHLYISDFDKDTIYQFVPKADKYRNLTIILDRVDTAGFPMITYYVTVLDADGFPIYGLSESNFLLRFGGGTVGKIDLSLNAIRDSRLRLLFLVDKSISMEQYREDVERYLNAFISGASPQDEMSVVNFNREPWIASAFTHSKLRTMDAILEERYDEGKVFDKAFRKSIDYINKEFYKKAVIVITDGGINDESFQTYSLESCIRYATNNHIPVYFLGFGGRTHEQLDYFARNTGGRFYNVLHSNDYPYLYNTIQGFRPPEYLIFFKDVYDPKFENFYLDAEVEVDIDGRIGKSRLGLIYPSRSY